MRYRKFIWASDNHGDNAEPKICEALFKFSEKWKPEIRIHGGDCWDFRWLRSKASDEERRERIDDDFDAGIEFLRRFKPTHFLWGNHDWRLRKAIESDTGVLRDLCQRMRDEIDERLIGCRQFDYNKRTGFFRIGKLAFAHGYHAGLNAARSAANCYGDVLMGHVHAFDVASVVRSDGAKGHTTGCLCKLELGYNEQHASTIRQSNGWAYGLLFPGGGYRIWFAEANEGAWYLPTEITRVA